MWGHKPAIITVSVLACPNFRVISCLCLCTAKWSSLVNLWRERNIDKDTCINPQQSFQSICVSFKVLIQIRLKLETEKQWMITGHLLFWWRLMLSSYAVLWEPLTVVQWKQGLKQLLWFQNKSFGQQSDSVPKISERKRNWRNLHIWAPKILNTWTKGSRLHIYCTQRDKKDTKMRI